VNVRRVRAYLTAYGQTYQVIQFLFFFALVICIQRLLSHMIAFAFHRTAFKDRLESLTKTLKTIDHLREYRPKNKAKRNTGGYRTPILSNLGFGIGTTPRLEKQEFITGRSRPATPDMLSEDEGIAGDIDDDEKGGSKKGKQRANRRSVFSMLRQNSESTTVPSRPDSPSATVSAASESHTYPPSRTPPLGVTSPSRPGTPNTRRSEDNDRVIVHAAKALKTAVLHDARNLIHHDEDEAIAGLGWSINSPREAKRLARSIYMAFKTDKRRNYLIAEDFYPAYATPAEAEEAFHVFDADSNGDISKAEIKTTLVRSYRERRFLSHSMRDVSVALKTLDRLLLIFAFVMLFFISLSVFGVDITSSLTTVYSLALAGSFVFKNSASNIFDAIMFIFVTHPFDTGDRCFIDDENLVVKKMGLFATVFARADGTESYYFNSQLFNKFITNARRSGKTAEGLPLQFAWRTPLEKLDALAEHMNAWLATEENRWFDPNTSVTLQKISFQRHLEVTMGISHNGNWQDWGLRNARKTAFAAAVNYYCRQLGISAVESPQPILYVDENGAPLRPSTPPRSPVTPRSPLGDESMLTAEETAELKPFLGFLPPPKERGNLLRARKSRSKKGGFHANSHVDGGDF